MGVESDINILKKQFWFYEFLNFMIKFFHIRSEVGFLIYKTVADSESVFLNFAQLCFESKDEELVQLRPRLPSNFKIRNRSKSEKVLLTLLYDSQKPIKQEFFSELCFRSVFQKVLNLHQL